MTDEQRIREIVAATIRELQNESQPSLDEKIQAAQTPEELTQIMHDADRQEVEEVSRARAIADKADFEKRQAAYDQALNAIDTPEELAAFMQEGWAEAHALAEAEKRFQDSADEELLEKISNAESVEELDALVNQTETHEQWLENRFKQGDQEGDS